nr:unnamed protein product [Spirometra erinaceieuropaei]
MLQTSHRYDLQSSQLLLFYDGLAKVGEGELLGSCDGYSVALKKTSHTGSNTQAYAEQKNLPRCYAIGSLFAQHLQQSTLLLLLLLLLILLLLLLVLLLLHPHLLLPLLLPPTSIRCWVIVKILVAGEGAVGWHGRTCSKAHHHAPGPQ